MKKFSFSFFKQITVLNSFKAENNEQNKNFACFSSFYYVIRKVKTIRSRKGPLAQR